MIKIQHQYLEIYILRSQLILYQFGFQVVIITGANSGIGKATALEMAKREARVILACRDPEKARQTEIEIRRSTVNGELVLKHLDLASFASIREFAADILKNEARIDVVINNAGLFQCPFSHTQDGLEVQMGVNHFGHFLLTNLLLDKLKTSTPSRIVIVSSGLHKYAKLDFTNVNSEKGYDKKLAYNNSKLANNYFARELSRRLEDTGVSVYCMHPGIVWTNLGRHKPIPSAVKPFMYSLAALFLKTPWQGCQTVMYCACAEELEGVSGRYYGNCKEKPWTKISLDDEAVKKMWDISESITKQ